MTEQIGSCKVLSESLLSAALATVLFAAEADIRSRAQKCLVDFTLIEFNSTAASKLTLTLPLLTEHLTVTADMSAKLCKLKTDGVCYLDNPLLAVPASLLSINITEDAVSVELSSQHWNLALRLVADRQPDETDNNGDTLLHLAAHTGHLQAIKIAIKSGASITITNKEGQSPYQLAQRRMAVQKGYDVIFLHRPCKKGDIEAVKVALCHKSSVHNRGGNRDTPLHTACYAGQAAVASLLIQLGANIEAKGLSKDTPLFRACESGNMDTVRLLLQHGAEVNEKCNVGNTPLHGACRRGKTEVSSLLIQHGAEVNLQNDRGSTPLLVACCYGRIEASSLLLQHGAGVSLKNKSGWTPLLGACCCGHTELASLLVQHGADDTVKTASGMTAADVVKDQKKQPVLSIFRKYVIRMYKSLYV